MVGFQISTEGGSLICRSDGVTENKKMRAHEECLIQDKMRHEQSKKVHKKVGLDCLERGTRCLDDYLNETTNKIQLMTGGRCSFEHKLCLFEHPGAGTLQVSILT